ASQRPSGLEYREEEQAGIAVPDEDDESSGSVLMGYGTSGGGAAGRTRARKRPAAASNTQPQQAVGAQQDRAPRVISPIVRQLAKRNNIDVSQLTGSGQDGIIIRADVLAAMEAQSDAPQTTATTEAAHDQAARARLA